LHHPIIRKRQQNEDRSRVGPIPSTLQRIQEALAALDLDEHEIRAGGACLPHMQGDPHLGEHIGEERGK
jgi:hypothetical protein